jgi:hypothetical protein
MTSDPNLQETTERPDHQAEVRRIADEQAAKWHELLERLK